MFRCTAWYDNRRAFQARKFEEDKRRFYKRVIDYLKATKHFPNQGFSNQGQAATYIKLFEQSQGLFELAA